MKLHLFEKKIASPFYHTFMSCSALKLYEKPATMQQNMEGTRKALLAASFQPKVGEIRPVKIGAIEGFSLDVELTTQGRLLKQRLYHFRNRGYMIGFMFSYLDEADLLLMERSLNTLRFN